MAPIGNTLFKKDEGIRLKDVESLESDLSADARIRIETFKKPQYTDDALEAGIEGKFLIDVFVDDKGIVLRCRNALTDWIWNGLSFG